jgi:hypothetical protein
MRIKVVQIVSAAAIPVLAATDVPTWVGGGLGALIVVLESIQQLFQFHSNWTHYRSTSEALKHEKYLYLARAGSYAALANPAALLAERIEGHVSQEHAAWASEARRHETERRGPLRDEPDTGLGEPSAELPGGPREPWEGAPGPGPR